jgi:hypothetical protein
MQENFGEYITTEIMAQNLTLSVTTEPSKAVCIMRGTVALGGFRNTGSASVQIIGPDGEVIWSATSGDKDSVKDLAHNLVKQLKRNPATTNRSLRQARIDAHALAGIVSSQRCAVSALSSSRRMSPTTEGSSPYSSRQFLRSSSPTRIFFSGFPSRSPWNTQMLYCGITPDEGIKR